MTLYTFNGSIPTEIPGGVSETDHIAAGWKVAPDKPECPDGKEVIWLNWEWVIREPKPADREGYVWKWNHDAYNWIEYFYIATANVANIEYVESYANVYNITVEEATNIISPPVIVVEEPTSPPSNMTSVSTSISGLTSTQISALTSTSIPSL